MTVSNRPLEKIRIPVVGKRQSAEGKSTPILSIDNRRNGCFGGYAHKPQKVISADALWRELQDKINSAKRQHNAATGLSNFFFVVSRTSSIPKPEYDYSIPFSLFPLKNLEDCLGIGEWSLEQMREYYKKFVEIQSMLEMEDRNRIRYVPDNSGEDQLDKDWDAFQKTLEPSFLDEDCLGSFQEWIDRMPDDIQYLLIGDTDHSNDYIRDWRYDGSYLEGLKNKGIYDLVIEYPIEAQPVLQRFFDGDISNKHQLKNKLSKIFGEGWWSQRMPALAEHAKHHGIRIHALDRQINVGFDPECPRMIFNRLINDAVLFQDIKQHIGERKAAIIYGEAHFRYEKTLIEFLGVEKCRVMSVYSSLKDFKHESPVLKTNAKYVPPYAYILNNDEEDGVVIATYGRHTRTVSPNRDWCVASLQMGKQEEEIHQFLERVRNHYRTLNDPDLYGINPLSVIETLYWYRYARKTDFIADDFTL